MWFDDDEVLGRRMGGRPKSILHVSATRSSQKRVKMQRATAFVIAPVAVIAVGIAAWVGLTFVGGLLFFKNDRFTITNLEIKAGDVISRELVKEYTGIREGTNLFVVNIGKVRSDFLRRAPNVKAIQIARVVPGTMKIELVERVPVARIGATGNLVTDEEGFVFWRKAAPRTLPIITGYKDESPHPGTRIGGSMKAAIELIETCDDPRFALILEQADLSEEDYLTVRLSCNGSTKEGRLAWPGMGKTTDSRRHLAERLGLLAYALHSAQEKTTFDATSTDENISLK